MASFIEPVGSQHPKSDKIIAKNIKNMLLSRSIPSLPSTLRRVVSGAAKQDPISNQAISINKKHYQMRRTNAFPYQSKQKQKQKQKTPINTKLFERV